MMTIVSSQQDVVDKLRETSKPLVRWPGGYWSYQGCSPRYPHSKHPSWAVSPYAVRFLELKGVLRRLNKFPEPWRDHRELV